MCRCIKHPESTPPEILRMIVWHADFYEKHLKLRDFTRAQAVAELKKVAEELAREHPEHCARLWYNVSKRPICGRLQVLWGIGDQPEIPEA